MTVLFPAPERPTRAIRSPSLMSKLQFLSTSVFPSYEKRTFCNFISWLAGKSVPPT